MCRPIEILVDVGVDVGVDDFVHVDVIILYSVPADANQLDAQT